MNNGDITFIIGWIGFALLIFVLFYCWEKKKEKKIDWTYRK